MIILCIPPLARRKDLGNNLPLPPLLIRQLGHLPRDPLLLGVIIEDPAPVLAPRVGALAVRRRRVMHAVEELEELAVRDFGGVVCDQEGFGVCNFSTVSFCFLGRERPDSLGRGRHTASVSRTHRAIAGALGVAADESYSGVI